MNTRAVRFYVLLGVALLVSVSAAAWAWSDEAPAKEPPTTAPVKLPTWLAGQWQGRYEDQLDCEEHWTTPHEESMVGMFRLNLGSGNHIYELMLIERVPAGVEFRLRHFGPLMKPLEEEPFVLPLTELTDRVAVFCDAKRDRPHRIEYRLDEQGQLVARVIHRTPTGEEVQKVVFKRVNPS